MEGSGLMLHDAIVAGLGFLSGGGTILLDKWMRSGRDRADTAKTLADVAVSISTLNKQLQDEVGNLKRVVSVLTNTVDEILPHITGLSDEQRKRLHEANVLAKLAI